MIKFKLLIGYGVLKLSRIDETRLQSALITCGTIAGQRDIVGFGYHCNFAPNGIQSVTGNEIFRRISNVFPSWSNALVAYNSDNIAENQIFFTDDLQIHQFQQLQNLVISILMQETQVNT